MSVEKLRKRDRLKLMQLACVAAWSDMSIQDEERRVVQKLAESLALGEEEMAFVERWLVAPPPDFDPYDIPFEHRGLFLKTIMDVVEADGRIDPEESETIRLLRELME